MTAVIGSAIPLVIAAAILAAALTLGATRSLRQALPVLLDLLTAAGLLRLSLTPTWSALTVTAGSRHPVPPPGPALVRNSRTRLSRGPRR